MKGLFENALQWKQGIVVDVGLSALEAVIVLLISFLYLIIFGISYGLETDGVKFIESLRYGVSSTLQPTGMIIYVTGILASTTAYFITRPVAIRTHPMRICFIFLSTVIIILFSTPLFIAGLQSPPENKSLAVSIAVALGVGALCVWLFSLFSQRRIFEREFTLSGNRRAAEIVQKVREDS